MPGVATGLAVTGTGRRRAVHRGDRRPTASRQRGLTLTGQLGDVMKESAQIALSYVRSHAAELGHRRRELLDRRVHVHVPAGAVPKDGPSRRRHDDDRAGVAAHRPAGALRRRR